MTTRRRTPPPAQDPQLELIRAYDALGQITSRLMLVNESVEASLSSHERVEVAERFLEVTARGLEIRRAALFFVDAEGFSVGAAHGLEERETADLAASQADIDACAAAVEAGRVHVADAELLTDDALEAVERGLYGEPGPEDLEAEGEGAEGEVPEGEEPGAGEGDDLEAAEPEGHGEAAEPAGEADEAGAPEAAGGRPFFAAYMPVRLDDEPVAVIGLGERAAGRPYSGDDLVFLSHLLRQFAVSLQRATLIERSEERLRETEALLKVSREITSTLDLDAVLRAVVNTAGAVVDNDRAEIALLRGDRLTLRAVSGIARLDPDQAEEFRLERPLEFLRLEPGRMQISASDLDGEGERPGAAIFREYFENQEMRSFLALPLRDDQGVLGFLCLESRSESWDIEPVEGDALDILAAQTTMAVRNAMLYTEIPLRGVAAPMATLRRRLGSLDARARRRLLATAAALAVVLLVPIFPVRAGGPVELKPLRFQAARSPIDGIVARVLVRGGESVTAGQPLALVEDLDLAGRIATLAADVETARRDVASARAASDFAAWQAAQIKLASLERTLAYEQQRAGGGQLTAPFDGQVLELDLARMAGQYLGQGEGFCTVARLDSLVADLEVAEERIGQVRAGQDVAVKVVSFPTRTFRGRVTEIGWQGDPDAKGVAHFLVRATIPNPGGVLRPGMTGAGRAIVGWRPLLFALAEPSVRAAQMGWW